MTATATPARSAWSARGWAIYLGWIVITLDGSALNLALPTIASQLQAPGGGIAWVVDAYTLPLAALLLLGGNLGDRWGAERCFRIGAIGFAAASIACALSATFELLIVFRAAQGVFAALLLPMVLALIGKSFDDARQRSTAVNMLTAFGGAGVAVGPFLGGLLTDSAGWRSVFWLTAPIAVLAALLVGPADRRRDRKSNRRIDVLGQITGTVALVALVGGLIEVGHNSGDPLAWVLLVIGALLLGGFVMVEHRAPAPMMPLSLFRSPRFSGAVIGGFAFQFGAYGLQFFLAIYIQAAWGLSAATVGLLLVPFAIGSILASVVVNPRLLRRGNRPMVLIGTALAAAGVLALLAVSGEQWWPLLVAAQFVVGAGTGIYSTALNHVATTSLGSRSAGLASGIYNTARQVGQSVGIAILGALAVSTNARVGFVTAIALVVLCVAAIAATELRPSFARRVSGRAIAGRDRGLRAAGVPDAPTSENESDLPFSRAYRVGDVIITSGQVGISSRTGSVPSDFEQEVRQAFTNLRSALREAGSDLSSVVKTTCLLADLADMAVFNRIYAEEFGGHRPARSAFQVGLAQNFRVEIEAIAVAR